MNEKETPITNAASLRLSVCAGVTGTVHTFVASLILFLGIFKLERDNISSDRGLSQHAPVL